MIARPKEERAPTHTTNAPEPAATPFTPAQNPSPAPAAAPNSPVSPDLKAQLDKLEHAIDAQRSDPALTNRNAELAAQTKTFGDNLAALTRRVDEVAATSQSAAKQADTARSTADAAKTASDAASKDQ